jgi:radical SAM superfamily enzyme YgiQ (UPF0313 family)
LSAAWLQWELERLGGELTGQDEADIILMTGSSVEIKPRIRTWIRKLTKNRRREDFKVILGGGCAMTPATLEGLADIICVGEGKRFIHTLVKDGYDAVLGLDESWIAGETRRVIPSSDFPWDVPPLNHPDGTVRLFASRGCRGRCLFCQTGWEMPFVKNPNPTRLQKDVYRLTVQGQKVSIITNDGTDHGISIPGQQQFVSVRLRGLRNIWPVRRDRIKSVRIGVEGVSERLRKAIKKPFDSEELLNRTFGLIQSGVGVRWFFIAGLPGETEKDWDELKYMTRELKRLKKQAVFMQFHAFFPKPAAPLGILPLEDTYWERVKEYETWFYRGPGFSRRVVFLLPAKYPRRIEDSQLKMACTEAELREGWFDKGNPNWRVKYRIEPDKMRKLARKYLENVALD